MAKQATKASSNSTPANVPAKQAQDLPMDIFKAAPQGAITLAGGGSSSPYIQFYHNLANNAQQAVAAMGALRQGDPFLVRGGQFVKLNPLNFILTQTYYQYFATVDQESKITQSIIPDSDDDRCPQGFTEFIEALIFVIISDKDICCARGRFRGPKCKGVKQANKALGTMRQNPDWVKESKQNGLVAKAIPADMDWAYLTHSATITTTPPKGNGKPYEVMTTDADTSDLVVLNTLAKSFQDEQYKNACIAAQRELLERWDNEILKKQVSM